MSGLGVIQPRGTADGEFQAKAELRLGIPVVGFGLRVFQSSPWRAFEQLSDPRCCHAFTLMLFARKRKLCFSANASKPERFGI
jgi:hypothetical protein